MSAKGSRKQLFLYHMYAWLVPVVIVLFALLCDYDIIPISDDLQPHYGDTYCWITQSWALLCFFAGPVACILIANIAFFTLTVRSICATSKATEVASGGISVKRHLLLNVKLTSVMGLTWVFGFIANGLEDSLILWYLFIVFGSLQGVFIFVGFVCNRRVRNMLRDKYEEISKTSKISETGLSRQPHIAAFVESTK